MKCVFLLLVLTLVVLMTESKFKVPSRRKLYREYRRRLSERKYLKAMNKMEKKYGPDWKSGFPGAARQGDSGADPGAASADSAAADSAAAENQEQPVDQGAWRLWYRER